jgi:hypothetical protein
MVGLLDSGTRNSATLHSLKLDPLRFATVSVAEAPAHQPRRGRHLGVTASRAARNFAMLCCLPASGSATAWPASSPFEVGGEEGALQTADVTRSRPPTVVPTPPHSSPRKPKGTAS